MGRSSVSAWTFIRDSIASSNTSRSPHSIRNERCMHFVPGWSLCNRSTPAPAPTRVTPPKRPCTVVEPETDRPRCGGGQILLVCPSRAQMPLKVLIFVYRTLCTFAAPTMPVTSSEWPVLLF